MDWTKPELKELDRYKRTNITEFTLFKRILAINPDRTYEAVTRKLRRLRDNRDKDKAVKSLRVGYLDIEASNLNADFGYILSWYIKVAGQDQYDYSVITQEEIINYEFDGRLVAEFLMALDNYDVLYTHWGVDRRFDIPFIRTRAYAHNLEDMLPDYMDKFIMDTWPIARNKLKLHNNRLDSIARATGIRDVEKTPLDTQIWQMASVGHPESLQYIVDHNKKDVLLLERIHNKLKKVERPIYRSI